jgi:L-ascorbate metabolism protein UlaG (beta-lactamase superfamily)
MGRFDDRATRPARGPRDILRWQLERLRHPPARDRDFRMGVREPEPGVLADPRASLTWVGHATFVAQLGGATIVTDPIWIRNLGTVRRQAPPGLPLDAVSALADFVLISHNHRDHLDAWTIRRLGARPTYVVPLGNARTLRAAGAERIVELDWWQTHAEREIEITLVPARHWSMRLPWDRNAALWGGFVVRSNEGSFYHSGDTAFFEDFREIGRRAGPIDWALLPIGAYAPRWFMESQHLCPEEAGEAFELLGARHLVAMHWGTFLLTDEPAGEPPDRLLAWSRERGLSNDRVWVLDIGETRWLTT